MKGGQPGFFDLEYSDEFNGDHLNTNKWVAIEKEMCLKSMPMLHRPRAPDNTGAPYKTP